jgi:hypothetical protein
MSDTQTKGISGNQITTTSSHNQIDDMPVVHPVCGTLPTASAAYRGHTCYVQGNGTTTADTFYICLMSATGTYSWKSIIGG